MSCKALDINKTQDNQLRRVGFELEFSGLTLEQATDAVQSALGGEARETTVAERQVRTDEFGDFNIELDWDYLKRQAKKSADEDDPDEWLKHLGEAARLLVPIEVVCPPIANDRIEALTPMIQALRKAGAVGTEDSLIAAYGLHVNTEAPSLDAPVLHRYLRAFGLLQWWLVDAHHINISRKISPYIDLYPEDYLVRLLNQDEVGIDDIFDDYLTYNASRNRALDLLPLLAELDDDRVRKAIDDPKIKARPAFHYRLPDCHIERSGWSHCEGWNTWWLVEKLAQDEKKLKQLGDAFLNRELPIIGVNRNDWTDYLEQWLKDQEWE